MLPFVEFKFQMETKEEFKNKRKNTGNVIALHKSDCWQGLKKRLCLKPHMFLRMKSDMINIKSVTE
jgi:endonuclease I